jgi:hypothetical protein
MHAERVSNGRNWQLPGLISLSLDASAFGKSRRFEARAEEGKNDPVRTIESAPICTAG